MSNTGHPERSRGIPWRYLKASMAGSLDVARDDSKSDALHLSLRWEGP